MTNEITISRVLAESILNALLEASVGCTDERTMKAAGELGQKLFARMYPIPGEEATHD